MTELATEFSGAQIISASSYDVAHPPSCIIDGDTATFWLTTGNYPQEFVLQLGEACTIKNAEIVSSGIRRVELAKCEGPQANTWETIATSDSSEEADIQHVSFQVPPRVNATYLRFKVMYV